MTERCLVMKQLKITRSNTAYLIWTKAENEPWQLFDSYKVKDNAVDEQIVQDLMCIVIGGYRFKAARVLPEE